MVIELLRVTGLLGLAALTVVAITAICIVRLAIKETTSGHRAAVLRAVAVVVRSLRGRR
ncbi:hypothetical protein GTY83_37015 [Streptomyces sp. SID4928]|uniref:hypothetical protein n=1 Tax=Streptomyces TaxID=1883 RepID=UPI0001C1A684|nr:MULTISPECIES: hypothetical protein [Streptomyces]EGE39455.1 hypothetical protein SACT1_0033 [Streptomyces sp. ACT-1]EGE46658.1 hypothetical protein SACT1_7381 [Streptomyces sp. ACT-1]MYR47555.1 hypothetical protein [Streptomyces sp. SID4928]MYR54662.1 hypothetical protein [Streptomyces sp. SID4928]